MTKISKDDAVTLAIWHLEQSRPQEALEILKNHIRSTPENETFK